MKKWLRIVLCLLIIVGLYNLFVFLIPFAKESVFWISYAYTMVAFGVGMGAMVLGFGKKSLKSKFYGFPIARVGSIYIAVQSIVGLLFMIMGFFMPWQVPVLVCSLLLGAALIGLITTTGAVAEVQRQDAKLRREVLLMRALQSKVMQLASRCDAPALKTLADELRYSDPVSSDLLQAQEQELTLLVSNLQDAVQAGDTDQVEQLCRRASVVLAERNRLCKLNKNFA